MRKTVLIIGAGASADFGYPLWEKLKEQLNNLDVINLLKGIEGLTDNDIKTHQEAFDEYRICSHSHTSYTLDRIIYEIDKPKQKHMIPTGHFVINIVGYLLAKLESKISDGLWITEFQNHLVDLVAQTSGSMQSSSAVDLLENLTVVSLNYDRVFEYFVTQNFFQKLIDHSAYNPTDFRQSRQLVNKTELKIYRPHGYICSLPNGHHDRGVGMGVNLGVSVNDARGIRDPSNDTVVPFGDHNLLMKENFLRMGRHMYMVNERGETDYANTNGALRSAEDIFCLGLSSDGIGQSSLGFREGQNVYLSNKVDDITDVSALKPGPDYKTLSKDGSRLNANDFTEIFIEISST